MFKSESISEDFAKDLFALSDDLFFMKPERPSLHLFSSHRLLSHEQSFDELEERRKVCIVRCINLIESCLFASNERFKTLVAKVHAYLFDIFGQNIPLQELKFIADSYIAVKGFARQMNSAVLNNLTIPSSLLNGKSGDSKATRFDVEAVLEYYLRLFEVLETTIDILKLKLPLNGYELVTKIFETFEVMKPNSLVCAEKDILLLLFEKERNVEPLEYSRSANAAFLDSFVPLVVKRRGLNIK